MAFNAHTKKRGSKYSARSAWAVCFFAGVSYEKVQATRLNQREGGPVPQMSLT